MPRLVGADSNHLKLTPVVRLAVRLGNAGYQLPVVVAEALPDVLFGTSFIDVHVASIDVVNQRLELRLGGAGAVVGAKSVEVAFGGEGASPKPRLEELAVTTVMGRKRNRSGWLVGLRSLQCRILPLE